MRAAAGDGDRTRFEQGWDELWDDLAREEGSDDAASVLLELARAAAQLGESERGERAAERALLLLRARGDARQLPTAEALLESVRRARGVRPRAESGRLPLPADVEGFAADLARALNAALFAG